MPAKDNPNPAQIMKITMIMTKETMIILMKIGTKDIGIHMDLEVTQTGVIMMITMILVTIHFTTVKL